MWNKQSNYQKLVKVIFKNRLNPYTRRNQLTYVSEQQNSTTKTSKFTFYDTSQLALSGRAVLSVSRLSSFELHRSIHDVDSPPTDIFPENRIQTTDRKVILLCKLIFH